MRSMRGMDGNSLKVDGPGFVTLFGCGTSSPVRTTVAMAPGADGSAMSRVKIPRTGPVSARPRPGALVSPPPPSEPVLRARNTTNPIPFTDG